MIPCHIVEDHNEVLPHIYRGIGSKRLPFENNLLLHLDAHPDLVISQQLDADTVFDKEDLFSQLSIENWIMPSLYAGHIRVVVWMKQAWAEQIPDGTYNMLVGKEIGSSRIRCTCEADYFVSELLYAPAENLLNVKDVTLHVVTAPSDAASCESLINELNGWLKTCHSLILDIDLDYFSTLNPFKDLYTDTQLAIMQELYKFQAEPNVIDSMTQRQQQLRVLKSEIASIVLEYNSRTSEQTVEGEKGAQSYEECEACETKCEKSSDKQYRLLTKLVSEEYDKQHVEPVDADLLHDHGCTFDSSGLPHHISSETDIADAMLQMTNIVSQLNVVPKMITIARSSNDDYCPKNQVDDIQDRVLHALNTLFTSISVHKHYLE